MAKFIVRRLLFMVLTMFIVSVVVFLLTEGVPGDVARHILGRFAEPEQVELFRRQLGLDRPLCLRYLDWLIGTDWRARRRVGQPLRRIKDVDTGLREWWVLTGDGTLKQWSMEDGELIVYEREHDGSVTERSAGDVWTTDDEGNDVFWGVDTANHAVKWQKNVEQEDIGPSSAGRAQIESGGGIKYIPLQRGLLRGDPGLSLRTNRPVGEHLVRRLRNSAVLAALAFVVVMPLALVLGILAGINEGTWVDRVLSLGGLVTTASPNFATGVFLILVLAFWLKLLPGVTLFSSSDEIFSQPKMLVLPVLTLTLIELGYVLRITRASMVEVMETAYIRSAILKGLPYRTVVFKHALRNALMAPITVIMLHVNWLMGGIVVVEALFGFPGLGTYLLDSALYKDVNAIEAGAMVMVVLAVGTQMIADIIYTLLNPRIRYD
jgi:peptide/nickel transport system permease protein